MKPYTKHRQTLKTALQDLLKVKEARKVEMRYRVIRGALYKAYPNLITNTDRDLMLKFLKDVVYLDRQVRLLTEGEQKLEKEILSQDYQIKELHLNQNYYKDVQQINEAHES